MEKKCPTLFNQTEHSDSEEEIEDSSDDEKESDKIIVDRSAEEQDKNNIEGEANDNVFNATTCLCPKEPATDMIVNHSNKKKNIKVRRKDKKVYEYAPGDDTCEVS